MSDEKPAASTSAISLGMACSVMSLPVLLYSAHDIFFWLPKVMDCLLAIRVKVRGGVMTEFLSRYGFALWVMVAVAIALSILEAYRRPGLVRTVRIQVAALAAAVVLAMLARHAAWFQFVSLFQGIGVEK